MSYMSHDFHFIAFTRFEAPHWWFNALLQNCFNLNSSQSRRYTFQKQFHISQYLGMCEKRATRTHC
jgi:hypothetical protein